MTCFGCDIRRHSDIFLRPNTGSKYDDILTNTSAWGVVLFLSLGWDKWLLASFSWTWYSGKVHHIWSYNVFSSFSLVAIVRSYRWAWYQAPTSSAQLLHSNPSYFFWVGVGLFANILAHLQILTLRVLKVIWGQSCTEEDGMVLWRLKGWACSSNHHTIPVRTSWLQKYWGWKQIVKTRTIKLPHSNNSGTSRASPD